jgi:hypothetical protein
VIIKLRVPYVQGISSLAKELLVSNGRFGFKELVSTSDPDIHIASSANYETCSISEDLQFSSYT